MTSAFSKGLSPLARGNRGADAKKVRRRGPIPARAGEPADLQRLDRVDGAYPRSRGGTVSASCRPGAVGGLSPLARGNPTAPGKQTCTRGPIPARAGEPTWLNFNKSIPRAYPPRVTILVASIEPRTLGTAMKERSGTIRTNIQGPGGCAVVAA